MNDPVNPKPADTGTPGTPPVEGKGLLSGEGEAPAEQGGLLSGEEGEGETVPETYELSVPEGMEIAPEQLEAFTLLAKQSKLSQKAAQELVTFASKHVQQVLDKNLADWRRQREAWQASFKADPEFGGQNLKATISGVRRVIEKFGDAELMRDLSATGMEDHPGLLRMLARVSKVIGEDRLVRGAKPATAPKSIPDTLYPTMQTE